MSNKCEKCQVVAEEHMKGRQYSGGSFSPLDWLCEMHRAIAIESGMYSPIQVALELE